MTNESKKPITFRLDPDLVERLRNAVAAHRGAPKYLTMDGFAENVLRLAVARLENLNGGKKYGKPSR